MLFQKPRIPIKDVLLYAFLPGFIKKAVYRLKGYKIGKNVSIGFGSVVCADKVAIGDHSKIGFFTIIRGKEIILGSHVSIGSTTFIDTPFVEIGDETKINEQVFVGGLQYHNSKFVLGKNCQVMQMSFINPAKSIVVGNDSGIGGHCLLFGHSSWHNQFDGYPVDFDNIEIGNSVSLTWRVFIMPGVKIGDGSLIAPNSFVNKEIPPKSLAAGYPARVISRPPDFPQEINEDQKLKILENIIKEMIEYFSGSGLQISGERDLFDVTHMKKRLFRTRKKSFRLGVEYGEINDVKKIKSYKQLDVLVSLKKIPLDIRKTLNDNKAMWLDIEKKERPMFWNDLGDEVVLFIRRYGVRFTRVNE